MPQYRTIKTSELGEIDFYGNAGVLSQFEDETGLTLNELKNISAVSFSKLYSLAFWAHYVASKRLKKDLKVANKNDLGIFIEGKDLIDLISKLLPDIIEDLGISSDKESEQKKT
jgi:hypothetical protein